MITVYGIKNCDTIKKTLKWLSENHLEFEFYDYKKQGVTPALAKIFLQNFSIDDLINRRGTTWRKLPETAKEKLDQVAVIELMCSQPSIIKRPVINTGEDWLIGYNEKAFTSLL